MYIKQSSLLSDELKNKHGIPKHFQVPVTQMQELGKMPWGD